MGRTKGAKNLTAEERMERLRAQQSKPKRGRGRPKGSVSKAKEIITAPKEEKLPVKKDGRGRPKGRKDKEPRKIDYSYPAPITKDDLRLEAHMENDQNFNSRLIGHIMQINEIRSHADKNDLLSLKSCFVAYLKLCQANGFCVTNLAAYAAMGMDYQGFINYARKQDPEVQDFVRSVRETCAMFREGMVSSNKLNPVIGIFWQRNYDGLRNDTEQIQNALEQDEEYNNGSKSYKEKYRNLIEGK